MGTEWKLQKIPLDALFSIDGLVNDLYFDTNFIYSQGNFVSLHYGTSMQVFSHSYYHMHTI